MKIKEELLIQLGFEQTSSTLWKHQTIGHISIMDDDEPFNIAEKIYDIGYKNCQSTMRLSLGIKYD